MKKLSFVQIVLIATVLCFLVSYSFSVVGKLNQPDSVYPFSVFKRYSDQGQNYVEIKNRASLPRGAVGEIEIYTKATEIHVEASDGNAIELRLDGKFLPLKDPKEQILKYEIKGNKLLVRTDEGSQSDGLEFGDNSARGTLTILIPKSIVSARLHSVSGKITGEDLSLAKLELETISSEVNFDEVKVDELSFKTVSGECSFSGQFQTLSGNSVSGDVEISSQASAPNIKLQSVSGDIEVLYQTKPDTGIEFHTTSGSIRISKAVGLETEASGTFSRVLGTGKGMLQIKTTSASVHLDLEQTAP